MGATEKRTHRGWMLAGFAGALVLALANSWMVRAHWLDDSYISLRYARNLALGNGMVFNPGERVEGYTNFGWVLALAVLQGVQGVREDITNSVKVLGLLLQLSMLAAAATAGGVLLRKPGGAAGDGTTAAPESASSLNNIGALGGVLWALLLAAYSPFAVYAMNGMETIAVCALMAWGAALWLRGSGPPTLGTLACFLGAALVRFDAALLLALALTLGFLQVLVERGPRAIPAWLLRHALPVLGIYAAYHGWRYFYFGDLLPNTYYAKVADRPAGMKQPPIQAFFYFEFYGLRAVAWLLGAVLLAAAWSRAWSLLALGLLAAGFQYYITRLPLDWMPFARMQMPIVPLFLLLVAAGLSHGVARWTPGGARRTAATATAVCLVLWFGARTFLPTMSEANRKLCEGLLKSDTEFVEGLRRMTRALAAITTEKDLVYTDIAGTPGYYGRYRLLDAFGLTDATIGRKGSFHLDEQGNPVVWGRTHPEYIVERQPNLLLMVTMGTKEPVDFVHIPAAVFEAEQLSLIRGFLAGYRVGRIRVAGEPVLHCYFLQRVEEPDRVVPTELREVYSIDYETTPGFSSGRYSQLMRWKHDDLKAKQAEKRAEQSGEAGVSKSE